MTFIDTSAIFALAVENDQRHGSALAILQELLAQGEGFLTQSYVLNEAAALIQHRLGLRQALLFLDGIAGYQVHWITAADHAGAVEFLRHRSKRELSLVDCASFVVMRPYGLTRALAFDRHFEEEGFEVLPAAQRGQ